MIRVDQTAPSSRAMLDEAEPILARAGIENPRLDARVLLAEACEEPPATIAGGALVVAPAQARKFRAMVQRRARREPLAYVVGHKEFFSLDFEVTTAVLIPRPETETLVEAALKFLAEHSIARVLDTGTGSGAIAVAVAANAPGAVIAATDIDDDALALAARNAWRNRCEDRIEFVKADLFPPAGAAFDLILANPPYVREADFATLAPEIRLYEPRRALVGGADGLAFYRRIASESKSCLLRGGAVMVEIGAGQADEVKEIFARAGLVKTDAMRDLAGIDRVIRASAA